MKKKRSQRPSQIKRKEERARLRAEAASAAPSEMSIEQPIGGDGADGSDAEGEGEAAVRVLLVDDNAGYRKAFKRRLAIEGFEAREASDADEAMEQVAASRPEVIVTDLAMRSPNEGLELIRRVKLADPLIPIIMISAVGTFEEGAEASRLGAAHVVSKARIDEEIDSLCEKIVLAQQDHLANLEILSELQGLRDRFAEEAPEGAASGAELAEGMARLQTLLRRKELDPYLKREAFDTLLFLESRQMRASSRDRVASLLVGAGAGAGSPATLDAMDEVTASIGAEFSGLERLDADSQETLRVAEFLYLQQQRLGEDIDFSRNVSFSYCFAVENEAKARLRRKLHRLFSSDHTIRLIEQFLERDRRHLTLYFHQFVLQSMRGRQMDVTIDNVRQTLLRILEYKGRYKPDGLKALGVTLMCFGRSYEFADARGMVRVNNPLSLRGLDSDREVMDLADALISLQHYRNPYIHPEISEPEKISTIRAAVFECLRYLDRLV